VRKKIGLVTILLLAILSKSQLLADVCPTFPLDLHSISNLEWGVKGQSIRMNIGTSPENLYLKSDIEWDIVSGELKSTTKTGTVEAIQFAEQAKITEKFLGQNDETHLELSPSLKYGLYTQKDPVPYQLYSFNLDSRKTIKLGLLSENLSAIHYAWYFDDKAVVTVEPMYGSGYQVIDVCLDGSCFTDLSQLINQPVERPAILNSQTMLATSSSDTSTVWLYNLSTKKIVSKFTLNVRLLPNLNPIWSENGKSLFLVGFNQDLSKLSVYEFNLGNQNLKEITTLDKNIMSINDWLIAPEKNLVVLSIPEIVVKCYP
jgi:hypothetical protein